MKLRHVLSSYAAKVQLGAPVGKLQVQQLRRDLERLRRENNAYFVVCVGMTIVIFCSSVWVLLNHLADMQTVRLAIGAMGLSAAGALGAMSRLWREKVTTDFLLTLCTSLNEDLLRTIVTIMSKRLR